MGRHRITNWVIKNAVGAYDAIVGASGTITTDKVPVGQADGTVIWDDPPGASGGDIVWGTNTAIDSTNNAVRDGQVNIVKTQTTDLSDTNEVVAPLRIALVKSASCTGNVFSAAHVRASNDASPGTGNLHTLSLNCDFTQNTADEATCLFTKLTGTGTGRLWGQDNAVVGPQAAQANVIVGHSLFLANYHNSSPTNKSIGLHITTGRDGEAHATETTYANDYGIVIDGICGAAAGTTVGFSVGIGIGISAVGGWAVPASRIGKGMLIQNFDTYGIEFGGAYTGSPPYIRRSGVFSLEYDGRLGLGTSSVSASAHFQINATARATVMLNSGVTASGRLMQANSTGAMYLLDNARFDGTNWVRDDTAVNSSALITGGGTSNPFEVRYTAAGAGNITWQTPFKITQGKSVVVGDAALATGATDGFLYVPTMAGAASGVPTAQTGTVALVFDTTNNRLRVYDGGWISVALA
jgi:hypothetical protein